MTEEQRCQFNRYGCIARCLIELAGLKGNKITPDSFCEKFGDLFKNPNQYGFLMESQVVDVIRGLKIAEVFIVLRRYEALLDRFSRQERDVLVFSETWFGGVGAEHCCLLKSIDASAFSLWNPLGDGSSQDTLLPQCAWEAFSCHGLILLP